MQTDIRYTVTGSITITVVESTCTKLLTNVGNKLLFMVSKA